VRSKQETDEAERRRITVAKEAAGGSEQQGVLDDNQQHCAIDALLLRCFEGLQEQEGLQGQLINAS